MNQVTLVMVISQVTTVVMTVVMTVVIQVTHHLQAQNLILIIPLWTNLDEKRKGRSDALYVVMPLLFFSKVMGRQLMVPNMESSLVRA